MGACSSDNGPPTEGVAAHEAGDRPTTLRFASFSRLSSARRPRLEAKDSWDITENAAIRELRLNPPLSVREKEPDGPTQAEIRETLRKRQALNLVTEDPFANIRGTLHQETILSPPSTMTIHALQLEQNDISPRLRPARHVDESPRFMLASGA